MQSALCMRGHHPPNSMFCAQIFAIPVVQSLPYVYLFFVFVFSIFPSHCTERSHNKNREQQRAHKRDPRDHREETERAIWANVHKFKKCPPIRSITYQNVIIPGAHEENSASSYYRCMWYMMVVYIIILCKPRRSTITERMTHTRKRKAVIVIRRATISTHTRVKWFSISLALCWLFVFFTSAHLNANAGHRRDRKLCQHLSLSTFNYSFRTRTDSKDRKRFQQLSKQ